jgi:putative transcriptional regulator
MKSLAGKFLIAKTMLQDPSFRQTVVLLLQHSPEGAFGLVVNRPTAAKGMPFPVFVGGPCGAEGLLLLHGHADWVDNPGEHPRAVAPGIYLGDAASLARVGEPHANELMRFRMFTGYAGWGPDQLERELTEGAWALVAASGKLLFDTPPAELWNLLLPPALPQPSLN